MIIIIIIIIIITFRYSAACELRIGPMDQHRDTRAAYLDNRQ